MYRYTQNQTIFGWIPSLKAFLYRICKPISLTKESLSNLSQTESAIGFLCEKYMHFVFFSLLDNLPIGQKGSNQMWREQDLKVC